MAVNKINHSRASLIAVLFLRMVAADPAAELRARIESLQPETRLVLGPLTTEFMQCSNSVLDMLGQERFVSAAIYTLQDVAQKMGLSAVELFGAQLEKLATACVDMLDKFASLSQHEINLQPGWPWTRRVCQTMAMSNLLVNRWQSKQPRQGFKSLLGCYSGN